MALRLFYQAAAEYYGQGTSPGPQETCNSNDEDDTLDSKLQAAGSQISGLGLALVAWEALSSDNESAKTSRHQKGLRPCMMVGVKKLQ